MSADTEAYVETLNRFARELAASTPTGVPGFVFIDTPAGKMVQLQFEYEQLQSMYRNLFEELTEERRRASVLRDRYENARAAAEQLARERDELTDALEYRRGENEGLRALIGDPEAGGGDWTGLSREVAIGQAITFWESLQRWMGDFETVRDQRDSERVEVARLDGIVEWQAEEIRELRSCGQAAVAEREQIRAELTELKCEAGNTMREGLDCSPQNLRDWISAANERADKIRELYAELGEQDSQLCHARVEIDRLDAEAERQKNALLQARHALWKISAFSVDSTAECIAEEALRS